MTPCPECGARTPGSRCIYCGYDMPLRTLPGRGLTWGVRAVLGGCGTLFAAFLLLLAWGALRPSVDERNQRDHPALVQARELLRKGKYSAVLDSLQRAPRRSAYTADLRGLALLSFSGGMGSVLRAREAFTEALTLDGEVAPAYLHLAACQALAGDKTNDILATLDAGEKLHPGNPEDFLQLRALVQSGKPLRITVEGTSRPSDLVLPIGH